jgi:hypothetical protein
MEIKCNCLYIFFLYIFFNRGSCFGWLNVSYALDTCTTCVLIVLGLRTNIKKITSKFKNTNIIPDSATTAANADNVYLNQKVSATVSCDCRSPPVIVDNRPQTRVPELCLVEFGVQRSLPVYIRNDR